MIRQSDLKHLTTLTPNVCHSHHDSIKTLSHFDSKANQRFVQKVYKGSKVATVCCYFGVCVQDIVLVVKEEFSFIKQQKQMVVVCMDLSKLNSCSSPGYSREVVLINFLLCFFQSSQVF